MMNKKIYLNYMIEFIGTFVLVFFGCLISIISNGHMLYVSLTFGLVVTVFISAFGKEHDVHLNPAVSLSIFMNGKTNYKKIILYIFFQIIGSVVAILLLMLVVDSRINLGANKVKLSLDNYFLEIILSLFIEAILTMILVCVIHVTTIKKIAYKVKGIIIGMTLFILILIGFHLTGASLNPARSFAPAIFEDSIALNNLWIYIIGPLLGSILSVLVINLFRRKERE